jgi:hypothetical protein
MLRIAVSAGSGVPAVPGRIRRNRRNILEIEPELQQTEICMHYAQGLQIILSLSGRPSGFANLI